MTFDRNLRTPDGAFHVLCPMGGAMSATTFLRASSNRTKCECVVLVLQGSTEINPRATKSINPWSAYDFTGGVLFVWMFFRQPIGVSLCHRYSAANFRRRRRDNTQVLKHHRHLFRGGRLVAFFADIHTVTFDPERVGPIDATVPAELWRHARITVHRGLESVRFRGQRCAISWNACA